MVNFISNLKLKYVNSYRVLSVVEIGKPKESYQSKAETSKRNANAEQLESNGALFLVNQ